MFGVFTGMITCAAAATAVAAALASHAQRHWRREATPVGSAVTAVDGYDGSY